MAAVDVLAPSVVAAGLGRPWPGPVPRTALRVHRSLARFPRVGPWAGSSRIRLQFGVGRHAVTRGSVPRRPQHVTNGGPRTQGWESDTRFEVNGPKSPGTGIWQARCVLAGLAARSPGSVGRGSRRGAAVRGADRPRRRSSARAPWMPPRSAPFAASGIACYHPPVIEERQTTKFVFGGTSAAGAGREAGDHHRVCHQGR